MISSLDDLLARWQESPECSVEELCQDQPELLPELRDRIAILRRIESLADGEPVPFVPFPPHD